MSNMKNLKTTLRKLALCCALTAAATPLYAQYGEGAGRGYRGFVTINGLAGNDNVKSGFNDFGGGIMTSHGFQFNPHIYLGAGMGLQFHALKNLSNSISVPYFADIRYTIADSKVSPYIDAKFGHSSGDLSGVYASAQVGLRIGLKDRLALNIGLAYALQQYDCVTTYYSGSHFLREQSASKWDQTLNLSLGIEF